MKSRQRSGPRGRWGEVLLGGAVGLGAPVVLEGMARMLGLQRGGRATVGWMAGLLGALVGGGLARRRSREAPRVQEAEGEAWDAEAMGGEPRPVGPRTAAPGVVRRGPSGRERLWQVPEDAFHSA